MRWLAWLVLGYVVFWLWMFFGSRGHCPSCGVELPGAFGAPWRTVDHCRCGWRRGGDRV